MKIAHESPNSIFNEAQSLTDYDYALVHLFEENEQYYENFRQALIKGREVILDNSIFELGEAFNSVVYADWIWKLSPTWYILPDSLENAEKTVQNAKNFLQDFSTGLPGKKIGVVQGENFGELVWCYKELVKLGVDMIGISFDYSYYQSNFSSMGKLKAWSYGRWTFLRELARTAEFNSDIPIHLLGCSLPQEFKWYSKEFQLEYGINIYSVDTSNPVVCGLKGIEYDSRDGLSEKPSQKLFELINTEVSEGQKTTIISNINQFRKFCNQ